MALAAMTGAALNSARRDTEVAQAESACSGKLAMIVSFKDVVGQG
jgi:hypothetical protein